MDEFKLIENSLYYGVSREGKVARLSHTRLHNINKTYYTTKVKILIPSTNNSKGYKRLIITYNDGSKRTEAVHRLVAKAFVPNPENKLQVNHKDGNKLNNNYSNLEWVTNEENQQHAALNLKREYRRGEKVVWSKLSAADVYVIAELIKEKIPLVTIANKFNVSKTLISEIKAGRTWRCLNLFTPVARKCEKYFNRKSRYVPTTEETQAFE